LGSNFGWQITDKSRLKLGLKAFGVKNMNRNNIWIHICIAVVLITMAAVWGQIRRWQVTRENISTERSGKTAPKPVAPKRSTSEKEPEVLVKFRPNVSLADIKKIAEKNPRPAGR
jgi:hypothetical protein